MSDHCVSIGYADDMRIVLKFNRICPSGAKKIHCSLTSINVKV
jgi:hypothetical protein